MVIARAFFAMLFVATMTTAAFAAKRVALVIGNGDYAKVSKLPNPTSDANAVAAMLQAAKFEVVEVKKDLGVAALRRALRDFSDLVREADIALVFYAGHGIEVNGTNYLIPVDAALERDIDVEDETVSLDRVTQILDPAKRLRIVILDACRDNPFVRSMKRTMSGRSIGRGLAKVDVQTSDTLIAFAAKAGFTAGDGEGANSPYTVALLKHLATPGLDLRLALGRVRDDVLKSTGNKQEPAVYALLGGTEIALVEGTAPPTAATVPTPSTQSSLSEAAQTWALIKDNTNQAVLEAYAKQFGDTVYGAMARARIEELKKEQVASAPPTSPLPSTLMPASEKATFAGGSFWFAQEVFEKLPGVIRVVPGYTGGNIANPNYQQVSTDTTGHFQAVQVIYDPTKISYTQLVDRYWRNIDPVDATGQFCDKGSSYQTAIFYHDDTQKGIAEQSKRALQATGRLKQNISTKLFAAGTFWVAEDYHQGFHKKNADRYQQYKAACGRDLRLDQLWGR